MDPDEPAVAHDDTAAVAERPVPPPVRRVPRLTLLALVTGAVAVLCSVGAVLLLAWKDRTPFNQITASVEGIPVHVSPLLAAEASAWAGVLVGVAVLSGLASAQATAAMRVLSFSRRHPRHLRQSAALVATEVLGPAPARELTAGRVDRLGITLRLTVLIPAHNEAASLGNTLESLARQERRPDRVVVVADNCTDDTVTIARANGAEVFATVDNTQKKAGALNQALAHMLPNIDLTDVFMVMDADTLIVPAFLRTALARLEADPDLIAVGGVFYGEEGHGLLGQFQRNEFTRYSRDIARRKGKVFVLTGTASLFRGYAFQAIADARGVLVPGEPGHVYDTLALTEDNEITLALKTLGAKMVSPSPCKTVTEVMPTWGDLWRQRERWQRGALENIGAYGLTRTTALYWFQQVGIGYGTITLNAYLLMMLITVLAADSARFMVFWLLLGLVFVVERVVTVWAGGWRARLLAAPLVIEICYDLFLQAVFLKSLVDIATGRAAGWNHVEHSTAQSTPEGEQ